MSDPKPEQLELKTQEDLATDSESKLGPEVPPDDLIDGRFQLESVIGEGGMGTVYKAKHLLLNRTVAIKLIRFEAAGSAKVVQRFQQEAKAATALSHEHIASVREFGVTEDGRPYLVIDYVSGSSLADVLKSGRMEPQRVIDIFKQACEAMSHAHQRGVLHRDLKPANILLTEEADRKDFVKIVDFGIAKMLPGADQDAVNLTQTGEVFGTPLYMSPEQCQGLNVDARSDIYAMGCALYQALVGEAPFVAQNSAGVIYKHVNETPKRFPRGGATDEKLITGLENVVLRCLEKKPNHRYQSMDDLGGALELVNKGGKPAINVSRAARQKRLFLFGLGCGVGISSLCLLLYIGTWFLPLLMQTKVPWNATWGAAREQWHVRNLSQAAVLLRRALAEAETGNASASARFGLYYDLGNVYLEDEQYQRSFDTFQQALRLVDPTKSPLETANTLELIAYCEYRVHGAGKDRSKKALDDYNDGITRAKKALQLKEGAVGPNHGYLSYTLAKLAMLYDANRDYKNAEAAWRRAIDIALHTPNIETQAAKYLPALARTLMAEGKRDEAAKCFEQAISIAKRLYGPEDAEVKKLEQRRQNLLK